MAQTEANAAMNAMVSNADALRLEIRRRSKTFQPTSLSPSMNELLAHWKVRFDRFRHEILKKSPSETPTGEDVEACFWVMHRYMEKNGEKVSYWYYKNGLEVVLMNLTFYHHDFQWTAHNRLRLDGLFNRLFLSGVFKEEPKNITR
ncbi:hypothetical protein LY78DRAFT_659465 [Colletotrichum sublineola]|uniref:Uncharacterized protein n=1 Tax=Colletotrichum sublineola TaxID=1173701 RepID=A0A066WZS2_COLSU|nr:hypothetical protein LY78DRAFT_659465 [Colletotrichum sublineola]KDN62408.1 hypothetical protein CSUB01_02438 [Colletotrichum sublineola]